MMTLQSSHSEWFPVSGSSDLPRASARAVKLHDEDIVIWRSESGKIQAWNNQCPHRGMRLSFGQVRGEQLSCRYHGWLFDEAGHCTRMPAIPNVKPAASICVPNHSCVEQYGLIWVSLDNDESAMRYDLIDGGWEFCKTLYVDIPTTYISKRLLSLRFPLFSTKAIAECHYQIKKISSGVLTVTATAEEGAESIMMAIQPLSAQRCGIHLCVETLETPGDRKEQQLHFHAWAQRLRWFLEHPCDQYDGIDPFGSADARLTRADA